MEKSCLIFTWLLWWILFSDSTLSNSDINHNFYSLKICISTCLFVWVPSGMWKEQVITYCWHDSARYFEVNFSLPKFISLLWYTKPFKVMFSLDFQNQFRVLAYNNEDDEKKWKKIFLKSTIYSLFLKPTTGSI
jgi:hypothetical protein